MMRAWLMILFGIVGTSALYLFFWDSTEEIVIEVSGWQLRVKLFVFLSTIIVSFIGVVLSVKLLSFVIQLPTRLLEFGGHWNEKRAQKKLSEALVAYTLGQYHHALKLLVHTKALPSFLRGAVGLIEARCHMHCEDMQSAQASLNSARMYLPSKTDLQLLTTEISWNDKKPNYVARELAQIIEKDANNLRAVNLLIKLGKEQNEWREAGEVLLRRIKKDRTIGDLKCKEIMSCILIALFEDAATRKDYQRIHWLYKNSGCKEEVQEEYAFYLALAGEEEKAEKILQSVIEKKQNQKAIVYFSSSQIINGSKRRLDKVKRWLEEYPDNPALLAAAARLYKQCGLCEQANEYYEKSLAIKADYQVWKEANL